MTQAAFERNLSAYIDDELTPETRREMETYMDANEEARKDYETHLAAWEAAGYIRAEPASDAIWRTVESSLNQHNTTTENLALIVRGLASEVRDLKAAVENLRQEQNPRPEGDSEEIRRWDTQGLGLWTGPGVERSRSDTG